MKNLTFKKKLLVSAMLCSPMLSSVALADDVEVITVLGEKIERSLKDTASSVSVIDKSTLDSGQYRSISDALAEVPNVVALTGSAPDIRGVTGNGAAGGFNSFTGGANARVSTLIDGVAEPFIADLTGDTGLWDIQQVEVFRGPQSTLNGRNSIGGTVYIKTMDPTFDWTGAARLGYRNQDNFIDSAVMLSGPIIDDQLAFRISGQNVTGNTYTEEQVYDTNPDSFDQNEVLTNRWRAKFLWQPEGIEDLKVMYSYSYNNEKGNTGRRYFSGDDPWEYKQIYNRYMDTTANSHALKFDYKLSDSQSFDLLVSYMDYKWGFNDYTAQEAAQQYVNMHDTSYTLDGKFNFGLDSQIFNGFIGLMYYERSQDFDSTGGTVYEGDDSSESKSIYGEVNYSLSDDWRITVGGRLMNEQQKRNFQMLRGAALINEDLDKDNDVFLPKLVVQYAVAESTTLLASARKGYNAGGGALEFVTNSYYYYDEESVYTYELASRSSFDNGNITLNANLFYNDYDGYQASNSSRMITNIDKSVTMGLEAEFTAMLTDSVQLFSGIGLLDSEIKEADPAYGDIIGNALNSTPNFTGNLGLKYWITDELTFGLSGHYVGEYYGDIANTDERIAGDYTTTRLNVDYQTDHWRVSGFVNNLFDEKAVTVKEPAGRAYADGYAAIIDPINFGISVTYSF
ncbi:TonB-dependent receptor [Shewanella sp. AS1]|uniref:TonB-dependent receptor n=1 Tax=Shewanella sp. AS1 TaxID=2907626 RepID=UPI001F1E99D0|nr:TonB-dependent receptor [Shewanella sp. AS1]MCE9679326.1 TonB-dependent receptor [Shewanella sp. AS1]